MRIDPLVPAAASVADISASTSAEDWTDPATSDSPLHGAGYITRSVLAGNGRLAMWRP